MRAFVGNCSVITVGEGDEARASSSPRPSRVVRPAFAHGLREPHGLQPSASGAHGRFGWSSLGAAHQAVAERFSGFGGVKGPDRYAGAEWETAVTGARLLKGAPAAFDCTVEEMIDRDTYSIVIGRVRAIRTTAGAGALIYWNGGFRALEGMADQAKLRIVWIAPSSALPSSSFSAASRRRRHQSAASGRPATAAWSPRSRGRTSTGRARGCRNSP
jgi:hypothetical protein